MAAPVRAHASALSLDYRPPLDWSATLAYFAARATPGVEAVEDATYWRTVRIENHAGVIGVQHDISRECLRLCYSPSLMPVRAQLGASVRRLFDLDTDPRPIVEHLAADARLTTIAREHPGLRVPGTISGFDLAVRAILGQQVSVK